MEKKLVHFESQDELKSRKKDNPEQDGYQESLRFSGFEVKKNEYKEECEHFVKSYMKNSLTVDIEESEYNRIRRIGPEIKKSGKTIVKFEVLINKQNYIGPVTQSIHRNPFRPYQTSLFSIKWCLQQNQKLRKCRLCMCWYYFLGRLRLNNGDWKFFNSLEEHEILLLEIQY